MSIKTHEQLLELWDDVYKGDCSWLTKTITNINGTQSIDTMVSANVGKIVCQALKNLVWSELPILNINTKEKQESGVSSFEAMAYNVLDNNKFWDVMTDYIEYLAAYGGFCIKTSFDEQDNILIDFVLPTAFKILKYRNKTIESIVFSDSVKVFDAGKEKTYTHYEKHDIVGNIYTIHNSVVNENGQPVSLSVVFGDTIEQEAVFDLNVIKVPFFVHIASPVTNNICTSSPYGISIFSNAIGTIEKIDDMFNRLYIDLEDNKTRLAIKSSALRTVLTAEGDVAEKRLVPRDRYYIVLEGDGADAGMPIMAISTQAHTDDIVTSMDKYMELLSVQTHFSPGTFKFDSSTGVRTATEVVAMNTQSYRLKSSFQNVIDTALRELIQIIHSMLKYTYSDIEEIEGIEIVFKDNVSDDNTPVINEQKLLVDNGFSSKFRAMKIIYGWTDEEVKAELKRMELESTRRYDELS